MKNGIRQTLTLSTLACLAWTPLAVVGADDHWTLDSSSNTLSDGDWKFQVKNEWGRLILQTPLQDPGPNAILDLSKPVMEGETTYSFKELSPRFDSYADRENLTTLILPASDVKIGMYAFQGTAIAGTLDLSHVTSLERSAFKGTKVTAVRLGPNLSTVNSAYDTGVFQNCTELQTVTFDPRSAVELTPNEGFTFKGCTSLETVDLCGVSSLKCGSTTRAQFDGCSRLKTVVMSNLVSITENVFYNSGAPADYHFYGKAPKVGEKLNLGKTGGTTYVHLFADDPDFEAQLASWNALTEGGQLNDSDSVWKESIAGKGRPLVMVLPPHEHVWGAWTEVVPVTDTLDGFRTRVCTVAGCSGFERAFVPAAQPVDGAIVYVDAEGENPVAPYATRATAAKTLAEALAAVTESTTEIHLTPGTYSQQDVTSISVPVHVIGDGAKREEVVLLNANPSTSYGTMKWVLTVDNADARVSNLTIEKGLIVNAERGYGAGITLKSGVVSNCLIRACTAQNMGPLNENNGISAGVLVAGKKALLTHSVVTGCRIPMEGSNTTVVSGAGATVMLGGRVSNCLFRDIDTPCGGIVSVYNGQIDNSTIVDCTVDKWKLGETCYGLCLTNAPYIGTAQARNVVIANVRKTGDPSENRAFCGLGASVAFSNLATDTAEAVGATCVTGTKETFFDGETFVPARGGPLWNAGLKIEPAPAVDLGGDLRVVGKIDIGCYECQKTSGMVVIFR